MNIKIIDKPDNGHFTVGNEYKVYDFVSSNWVWAYDDKGNIEAVYAYEFEWV